MFAAKIGNFISNASPGTDCYCGGKNTLSIKDQNALIGDKSHLQQILINLIGNAIKFTDTGGITLKVQLNEQWDDEVTLTFSVSDTGIGIAPDKLATLFQPFSQGDASITRRYGGTGLGLAISKEYVQLMGGTLQLESQPNLGTHAFFAITFKITILKSLTGEKNNRESLPEIHFKQPPQVLLVDDNQTNQMVASRMLKKIGCAVDIRSNGEEAIEAIMQQLYDIVLMDCQMPILDGFEATRHIRSYDKFSALPIISLSVGVTEMEQEQCSAAGMNDFLSKPLNFSALSQMIVKWVTRTER